MIVRRGSDRLRSARRTDFTLTLVHRRGRGWQLVTAPVTLVRASVERLRLQGAEMSNEQVIWV